MKQEQTVRLVPAGERYKEEMKALYLEAFPKEERKPFELMERLTAEGRMEMLAIVSGERFVGLDINMLAPGTDLCLLDYFAVSPSLRGGGYGSLALSEIVKRFSGRRMIYEIEPLSETAENAEQRRRRKRFYLRNGLLESGLFVELFGVPFELLYSGGEITFEDYLTVFGQTMGAEVLRMAAPRLLRAETGQSAGTDSGAEDGR